jgi:hypothetical protein
MNASSSMILALATCLTCACAEGYSVPATGTREVLTPPSGGMGGEGGDFLPSTGGAPAAPSVGEPCIRGDVAPCPCEGTDVPGQRICVFDMASPTQGFFSDCQGCLPAQEPVDVPDAATCTEPPCMMPTAGSGGMSGSAGMSGAGGMSNADAGNVDPPIDEPVEDCDGVPEGTECDRDCILPGNTAHCNERGDCSCL